jgi:TetR/AcrR family transcriptional regulator, acrAB operon repressor
VADAIPTKRTMDRQELIVRVAAEIISDLGIERTTFREIAIRAGVSKGVVEHHFHDKSDIVRKTLQWLNRRALEREQRATRHKEGLEAIRQRMLSLLPTRPEMVREWKIRVHYWSMSFSNRDEQLGMSLRIAGARERFEADIAAAAQRGEIPPSTDCRAAAKMLLHLVAGVSCNRLVDPAQFNRRYQLELVEHVLQQLRDGHL